MSTTSTPTAAAATPPAKPAAAKKPAAEAGKFVAVHRVEIADKPAPGQEPVVTAYAPGRVFALADAAEAKALVKAGAARRVTAADLEQEAERAAAEAAAAADDDEAEA